MSPELHFLSHNLTPLWKTYYRWVHSLSDFHCFSSIKYLLSTSVQTWISWKRNYTNKGMGTP